MAKNARLVTIHVERGSVADMTDSQIETLMSFGRREAELIDELEDATRAGDRDRAWRLSEELCRVTDEALQKKQ